MKIILLILSVFMFIGCTIKNNQPKHPIIITGKYVHYSHNSYYAVDSAGFKIHFEDVKEYSIGDTL